MHEACVLGKGFVTGCDNKYDDLHMGNDINHLNFVEISDRV
jgi:hypothetical protein